MEKRTTTTTTMIINFVSNFSSDDVRVYYIRGGLLLLAGLCSKELENEILVRMYRLFFILLWDMEREEILYVGMK